MRAMWYDDDRDGQPRDAFGKVRKIIGRHVQIDAPPEPRAPARRARQQRGVELTAVLRVEGEADTANACDVHPLQRIERRVRVQLHDSEEAPVRPAQRVQRHGIVRTHAGSGCTHNGTFDSQPFGVRRGNPPSGASGGCICASRRTETATTGPNT
jgi:hypothetical protein